MEQIKAGYRGYNGHIFSERDAKMYNQAVAYAAEYPTEQNKNYAHRLYLWLCHFKDKEE